MLTFLYFLCIAPLEFLMRLVLEWGFSLTHSWGLSLILLSLAVNTAILPIYNRAERWQEAERALRRGMARHEGMIRESFAGQERFALLSALRRLRGYGYGFTLRASVGLILQVPFFIAAYHLLSGFTPLSGQSFACLPDLGAPDALLSLGGISINLLPIVMTAVNLLSAFVYTSGLSRRDKAQIYAVALLFLILLYASPAALTLYWTLNNVYSLAKNVVEKDWMRRPGWARFRSRLRVRWTEMTEHLPVHARGWLRAFRCGGIVGAVFWLYVGALALSRQGGALDEGLRQSLWSWAGQCALSALSAGLVLGALFPFSAVRSDSGGRPGWRSLALVASVALLFALQSGLFSGAPASSEGRVAFALWDVSGALAFVLWTLCLLGARRYGERVGVRGRRALARFFAGRAARGMEASEPSGPLRPSKRDTFLFACILGCLCGLFFWYFMPLCTYFYNVNEFEFNGWELFWRMTPCCLLTAVVVVFLIFITTYFLPYECIKLPWKTKSATYGKVNIVFAIMLTTLFIFWLEGAILSYGLPQFTGEENLFSSRERLIVDFVILIDIYIIGIYYWKRINSNFCFLSFVILLLVCSSFVDAWRVAKEKVDIRKLTPVEDLRIVNRHTLYSQLVFSNTHNVIILLVDSLDTLTFEKTLELYPDLREVFDGFWLFRDNLGPGGFTMFALPQILSGQNYEGAKYADFVFESLVGKNSIAANALNHRYKVFVNSKFWCVKSRENMENGNELTKNTISLQGNIIYFILRFLPYYGKQLLEPTINLKQFDMRSARIGDDVNKQVFNKILARIDNVVEQQALQFHYFFGVHPPFLVDNDIIKTANEFLIDFGRFADSLKSAGLYDNSTIVIMADHGLNGHRNFYPERKGAYSTFFFPLLMIKGEFSTGTMMIRDDLMSSIYVNALVNYLQTHGSTNDKIGEYLSMLPSTRTIYKDEYGKMEAVGNFSTLSLKKVMKNVPLIDNTIYAMDPSNIRASYAYPKVILEDSQDNIIEGADAPDIVSSSKIMSFYYNKTTQYKKKVTFYIDSWNNNGSIEITDNNSGNKAQWKNRGPVSIFCSVDENGYINVKFSPLIKQASSVRYIVIQEPNSSPPTFPSTPREQNNKDMLPIW